MEKIAIIGLGYVGLPLSIRFAEAGTNVIGIDIDLVKTNAIKKGKSFIKHIKSSRLKNLIKQNKLSATNDFTKVRDADAIILCLPTPLDKFREPDLSFVLQSVEKLAPHIKKGALISLESTTYPGTTEGILKDYAEKFSGMKAGLDFHLAYSPEREDPGNKDFEVKTIPKVIGGYTPKCLKKAIALYSKAIDNIHPVSSCAVAEASKLTENIFRSVNIALVNELKVVYAKMGVDVWEVIEAAKTKPFGYMPFYPGPGLGGHCIPIDPFYLTWKAREFNQHTRFIELAGEINKAMPDYVVKKVAQALNHKHKSINGSKILVLGLAYKSDIDDMRESPSFDIMDKLAKHGGKIDYCDPNLPVIPHSREHSAWEGKKSVDFHAEILSQYDCVIIATVHKEFDFEMLVKNCDCIVDTRNALKNFKNKAKQIWKA